MVTVNQLYEYMEMAIPKELSCEWDNDGRMCIPSPDREVKKVLVSLDASECAIDYAIREGFDCIITHHPLVFDALKSVDGQRAMGRKLCKLIKNDISVMSFHTRLDAVSGGVNDALADALGLKNINDFSDVGRIGEVNKMGVKQFGEMVKKTLGADKVLCVDAGKDVNKIALVGGSGKGYLEEAVGLGCDTFLTGEMPYNYEQEAKELRINLVCGGHYFTENTVCERLVMLLKNLDSGIVVEIYESNPSFVL